MLNGNIKVLIGCLLYLGRGLEVGPLQPSLVYDLHTHLIGLNGFVNNTCKGQYYESKQTLLYQERKEEEKNSTLIPSVHPSISHTHHSWQVSVLMHPITPHLPQVFGKGFIEPLKEDVMGGAHTGDQLTYSEMVKWLNMLS